MKFAEYVKTVADSKKTVFPDFRAGKIVTVKTWKFEYISNDVRIVKAVERTVRRRRELNTEILRETDLHMAWPARRIDESQSDNTSIGDPIDFTFWQVVDDPV